MRIIVIDPNLKTREPAILRVDEALRQSGLKRVELVSGGFDLLLAYSENEVPSVAFLGPGCYSDLVQSVKHFRAAWPQMPLAVILDNDIYATEAVELRRELAVRIMPLADIAQIVQFLLDTEFKQDVAVNSPNKGIVSVLQFKGGVGASTLSAALAACWARHELSVALLDFDDVNPQITDWGRVSLAKRKLVAEFLRRGEVPRHRVNEFVHPVEGFNGQLVVIAQPEYYREGFHFKADVLENSPSSAEFVSSLFKTLQDEFDVLVVDTGRSWGISTFAMLPLSEHVLVVVDDDGMSVCRTLDNLLRIYQESDDTNEFDLSRWSVVLNAYTGRLLSPADISHELEELDIFPADTTLYTIPFSERGRQWGAPGQTLYDLAEEPIKEIITELAFRLIPFRRDLKANTLFYDRMRSQVQRLVGMS